MVHIPPVIGSFKLSFVNSLQVLNLARNKIQFLPNEFCRLKKLIQLDLSQNKLEFLPNQVRLFCYKSSSIFLKVFKYIFIPTYMLLKIIPVFPAIIIANSEFGPQQVSHFSSGYFIFIKPEV
jgi:hypothetical protein